MSYRFTVPAAVAAALAAAGLAACGSSDTASPDAAKAVAAAEPSKSSGSDGVAYAKQQLAKYAGPAEVKVPGKPFDATKANGKTAWYIPISATVPAETSVISVLKTALAKAGVKLQVCDSKGGDPVASNGCVTQAVRQKADVIVTDAITPDTIRASLQLAKKAGIPTVVGGSADPSEPVYPLANATVAYEYTLSARLVADWVISDSNGKANVLVIDTDGLSLQKAVTKEGYEKEFADHCPDCKVTVKGVPSAADWATKITPLVSTALTADPNIDYVVAEYDAQAAFAAPAIMQAGKANKVKIATFNADLQQMQQLAAGKLIGVEVGSSQASVAYAYADQALRLIVGVPPIRHAQTGTRVFTKDNVSDLDLSPKGYLSGEWYGTPTFEQDYAKEWGLGS